MAFVMQTAEFEAALREYQSATKKDMAECLNRALGNVGRRAAQFTPKKDPAQIERELRKEVGRKSGKGSAPIGLMFITGKLTGKKGTTYTTRKGKTRTIRRVSRKQITLRWRQFIKRRQKRTGFLRAGWVAALANAGLKNSGKEIGKVLTSDSKSTLGTGKQATPQRLIAYLGNGVWGRLNGKGASKIRNVMQQALRLAMSFVANDMKTYARDLMNKTAKKYSAQRKVQSASSAASISSQLNALLRK